MVWNRTSSFLRHSRIDCWEISVVFTIDDHKPAASARDGPVGILPLCANKRFRFGRFELDVHARSLRKDGVRFRLQDQPFIVLQTLLEQADSVVTREELYQRIWSDGTHVDWEHGL